MPRRTSNQPYVSSNQLPNIAFFLVIDFLIVGTIFISLEHIAAHAYASSAAMYSTTISTVVTTTVASAPPMNLGPQALNITFVASNDEMVGCCGYWALANYTRTVKAYPILGSNSTNAYFLIVSLNGTWNTFAGALSPNSGIKELHNGSGTFDIRYSAIEDYALNTSAQHNGYLGRYYFGGSARDIMKGAYANQTGALHPFQWTSRYFGFIGAMNITDNYTGTFTMRNQTYSIIFNSTGEYSEGDIVT
jgi:hypothetical protein